MFARLGVPARTADDRHRAGGIADQIEQRLHRVGAGGLRGAGYEGAGDEVRGHLLHQHVFRQGKHHRPRPAIDGNGIGARDVFRDPRRIINPRRPFADRGKERREVDLLKPLAPLHPARDIAHEQDHRLRILMRDVDADAGIGRARPAGDESDSGSARARCTHCAIGAGHERCPAFLPAGHHINLRPVGQRIEHAEEAFPRHSENPLTPLNAKAIDQQGSGAFRGNGGC